jgi:nitroreductase
MTTTTSAALDRRYGTTDVPEATLTETITGQLAHRSVRRFLPSSVSDGDLAAIVAAAQSAATSSNQQSWSVVVVEDRERLARLAHLAGGQAFIADAAAFFVWVADLNRAATIAARAGHELGGADYLESTLVASIDAALAAQNAVVAAESLGWGTVYVGAVRNNPVAIAAELGLPPRAFAVVGLAIGRPDPDEQAGVKPRLPQSAVVHREQYDPAASSDGVAVYGARLSDYYDAYGIEHEWTASVARRWKDAAGLNGRHRLRSWLEELGFPSR